MADLRDALGNPVHHTGAPGAYGTTTGTNTGIQGTTGTGIGGGAMPDSGLHGTAGEHKQGEHHGITGMLHRSGSSSSSSSSEDDGHGGRRKKEKKGLKEKIKEKLPGGRKDTPAEPHGYEGGHVRGQVGHETHQETEKKGIMEKIKEKLPGHNKDEGHA